MRTLLGWLALWAGSVSAAAVPPALEPWRDWAGDGLQHLACPWLSPAGAFGDAQQHVCAWPQTLTIEVDGAGARFRQRWRVYADADVPLPGDRTAPPIDVRTDGAPAAVLGGDDAPSLRLPAGEHEITGTLAWAQRPGSLRVPTLTGVIDLRIDGVAVPAPRREGERLWLGESADTRRGPDSLALRVYRELADGVPLTLSTSIQVDAGGRAREVTIGPVLPDGFAPMALSSELPALLQGDGRLRVQLRPGVHMIEIDARATAADAHLAPTAAPEPWPAEEIWGWRADQRLRSSLASGGSPIDPAQAGAPWHDLPSFVLAGEQALTIAETARGLGAAQANRLHVQRELWLSFDGDRWLSRDRVGGRMLRDWRLDAQAPWRLLSARDHGEPALITTLDEREGVELRLPSVALDAQMSAPRGALPASGWQQPVEQLHIGLNLPPGYRLIAAPGADAAPQAWLSRFNLLDIFLIGVVALLAGRWLGVGFAAAVALYAALVWHEASAPRLVLLPLFAFALAAAALAGGRFARLCVWLRNGLLVLLALYALPFAADQIRYALYPQLEPNADYGGSVADRLAQNANVAQQAAVDEQAMPAAPPPPPAPASLGEQRTLDRVEVSGSRIKRADLMEKYAADALPQSGVGLPEWRWRSYALSWNGPVLPAQTVRPVILPPWALRLVRALMVLLLAAVLARAIVVSFAQRERLPPRWRWLAASLLILPGLALAQSTPAPELLAELRERLGRAPDCAPACVRIERASVAIADARLRLTLDVHAGHRVAMPVPFDAEALGGARVSLDDGAALPVYWRDDASLWLPVEPGVQRIVLDAALLGDTFSLRFALRPALVDLDAPGWQATGLASGRLQGDTLQLVREATGEAGTTSMERQRFAPFVRVHRELQLNLDWTLSNRVQRLAPDTGGFEVRVPLLDGEQVQSEDAGEIADGAIAVAFAANAHERGWESRLPQQPQVALTAPALDRHVEVWSIVASPWWHVEVDGVPAVLPEPFDDSDTWRYEFHPLPGETLTVRVSRPPATQGATLAIDRANLVTDTGQRARDHTLDLVLRATRGGAYDMALPADAELIALTLDGRALELRPDAGRLTVPMPPGEHALQLRLRESDVRPWSQQAPRIDLGAAAANLNWQLSLPNDRWVLWTHGPRLGPSVQYWPLLLLMLAVALALARTRRTPLKWWHWLLLGLGFSTFAWWGFALVALWLLLLDWRCRFDPQRVSAAAFQGLQLVLIALSVVAVAVLIVSVPFHLLGQPDMQVAGYGSSAHQLRWFDDASTDGAWFQAGVLSAPLWLYKLAMLAWALWLASALIAWLRWAWRCLSTGGFWRSAREPAPAEAAD